MPDTDGSPSNYAKLPAPISMDSMVVGIVVEWLVRQLRERRARRSRRGHGIPVG